MKIFYEVVLIYSRKLFYRFAIVILYFCLFQIFRPHYIYSQIVNYDSMVLIPSGEFIMGIDEKECNCPEFPMHKVFLDSYFIDVYEVTNSQYEKFIEARGYLDSSYWSPEGWLFKIKNNLLLPKFWNDDNLGIKNPNRPVVGICWYEAYAYAKWKGKRLPTEAEWEKAARGNQNYLLKSIYPWGIEEPDQSKCNFGYIYGNTLYGSTKDAGSYENGKSQTGLYDMAGNVSEWCFDWYSFNYYSESVNENPQGPEKSDFKCIRGGSWLYYKRFIRVTTRDYAEPSSRSNIVGFRCAKTP